MNTTMTSNPIELPTVCAILVLLGCAGVRYRESAVRNDDPSTAGDERHARLRRRSEPRRRVLVADPGAHSVSVVDLDTGTGFTAPWEGTEYGPTEIKVIP